MVDRVLSARDRDAFIYSIGTYYTNSSKLGVSKWQKLI